MENKWAEKLEGLVKVEEFKLQTGIYRGYMKEGQRHGPGTFRFSNGTIFNGEFQEDLVTGFG